MVDAAVEPGPCRNCGSPAPGRYCASCGQSTHVHIPSVLEFGHELVGHYVAFEGPMLRTLKALFFKPGQLAADFIEGRRARYVGPLRLYLTASVISFLLLSWIMPQFNGIKVDPNAKEALAQAKINISEDVKDPEAAKQAAAVQDFISKRLENMSSVPDAQRQAMVRDRFLRDGPTIVLFMVPVLALLSMLVYWGRHRLFGEHLVVALNLQTFGLVLLALSFLPLPLSDVLTLVMYGYSVLTYRRVFGGRWVPTALRAGVIAMVYFSILLSIATMSVLATLFH